MIGPESCPFQRRTSWQDNFPIQWATYAVHAMAEKALRQPCFAVTKARLLAETG